MSATLIGNNVTVKINGAVSNSASATSGATTLYTAPATGYAIVNLFCTAFGSSGTFTVGGRVVHSFTGVSTVPIVVYVGPSQVVQITATGAANTGVISGVDFVNSP